MQTAILAFLKLCNVPGMVYFCCTVKTSTETDYPKPTLTNSWRAFLVFPWLLLLKILLPGLLLIWLLHLQLFLKL